MFRRKIPSQPDPEANDPEKLKEELERALHAKNWEKVLALSDLLLNSIPKDFRIYIIKGDAHMALQDYHKAVEYFEVAWCAGYSDGGTDSWKNKLKICRRIIGLDGMYLLYQMIVLTS